MPVFSASRFAPIVALGVAWIPSLASAGNTVHPRTPVQWPDAECMQTVERSSDPRFEFSYEIPAEDLNVTADELEDSRRHQFVAFCQHWERESGLPGYLSEADRMRAVAAGLETADLEEGDVLESDAQWSGDCWVRVTPDEARRPISFEAASEPVVWDTTDVAAGVYRIAGYTWEPPLNLWSAAPWAVRVVDDLEQDVGPAAVLGPLPIGIAHDEALSLDVCLHAPLGSRVELAWALKQPAPRFEVLETAVYDGRTLELELVPPEPSFGESILVAVTVEDPSGRRYTAHGSRELIVFAEPQPMPDDSGSSGETGSSTGADGGVGEEGSSGGALERDGASPQSGCTVMRSAGRTRLGSLVMLTLVVLGRRKRGRRT